MDEALTIGVRRERDYAIVTAAGEIDIATGAGLRERLSELAVTGRRWWSSWTRSSLTNSAGLGALVGAAKRAAAHGASLHAACARPR